MSELYDLQRYRQRVSEPGYSPEAESEARWARIEALGEETRQILKESAKIADSALRTAKEASAMVKETLRAADKTSRAADKTLRAVDKMSRAVEGTSERVDGMSKTHGRVAEEFFHAVLLKAPCLGGMEFHQAYPNFKVTKYSGGNAEYDLLLMNGEFIAVIEIKHRLRRDDVERMREVTLPRFRYFLPQYKDKALAPAVAAITADQDAVALAHKCGYAVLRPDGQKVRADVKHLRYIPGET